MPRSRSTSIPAPPFGGPLVRRMIAGFALTLALTATLVALPVYTAPIAQAQPVATSVEEVELGSVTGPEGDAVVSTDGEAQPGGVDPAAPSSPGAPAEAPADDVPVSGAEEPGIPALTLSDPDSDDFSSVGVTWRQDAAVVDVVARIRVKDADDGTWGEWTTLEPDDVVQRVTEETADNDVRDGTAPYWTGPADGIEAIVQATDGTVPEHVRLTLI